MKFFIEIVAGPRTGSRFPLGDSPVTLGRKPGASLPFPEDNFLSGLHCSFQATSAGLILCDLDSTNGTFLNGQRIQQAELHPGDSIAAGSLALRVAVEAPPAPVVQPPPPEGGSSGIFEYLASLHAPLYALVDAACDKSIPGLLVHAQEQHQSLYEGRSATELAAWAPYLVELPLEAPLIKALIAKGWGKGWASYFTSKASFQDLRHHFRRFLMVQIENGALVYFRFYDPRVLRDFLPTTTPGETKVFFGPVEIWFLESEDPQSILSFMQEKDGLVARQVKVESP